MKMRENKLGGISMVKTKVEKAKDEIGKLQEFVNLVESYQADTSVLIKFI